MPALPPARARLKKSIFGGRENFLAGRFQNGLFFPFLCLGWSTPFQGACPLRPRRILFIVILLLLLLLLILLLLLALSLFLLLCVACLLLLLLFFF